jgi:hypothetical protein
LRINTLGVRQASTDFWRQSLAEVLADPLLKHLTKELTTVRDNLRHASLATTSMYLHADDARRAKQVADRFEAPKR